MGVVFIPIYIRLLGLESFGLVGFFVTLQAMAVVFDLGLAGTINRELARRGTTEPQSVRDLVRTLEWFYWPLGFMVAVVVWLLSGTLAESWLRPVDMDPSRVSLAIALMGGAIGAQWPTAFYVAGLNGLQRQVLANSLAAAFGTLRGAGVLVPLAVLSPTVEAFFIWQGAICALQTVVFAAVLWRALLPGHRAARFSAAELSRVGGFTAGLSAIAVLSFVLMQADRIVLSRVLTLDQFGVYAIAAAVAATLVRFIQPWFAAMYPRFTQLLVEGRSDVLRSVYHASCQGLATTVLPAAAVIAAFAEDILRLWTGDSALSAQAAPVLAVLTFGSALHGLMHLPYAMQLAHGWTSLALWANVVGVCFVVPAVWWLTKAYGPVGAAAAWVLLNLAYVLFVIPLMHGRILKGQMADWYLRDVGPPAAASLAAALALRAMVQPLSVGVAGVFALASIYGAVTLAACVSSPFPRRHLLGCLGNVFRRFQT
jgi:O-antigen/teichoic acid export membrane protein